MSHNLFKSVFPKIILNNLYWDLVVTLSENHWIIHLFKIIEILYKFKIFKYHWIRKFSWFIKLERSLIFSSLKKSILLKLMFLLNFLIQWFSTWKNICIKNNNLMILNRYYTMILIWCYPAKRRIWLIAFIASLLCWEDMQGIKS